MSEMPKPPAGSTFGVRLDWGVPFGRYRFITINVQEIWKMFSLNEQTHMFCKYGVPRDAKYVGFKSSQVGWIAVIFERADKPDDPDNWALLAPGDAIPQIEITVEPADCEYNRALRDTMKLGRLPKVERQAQVMQQETRHQRRQRLRRLAKDVRAAS